MILGPLAIDATLLYTHTRAREGISEKCKRVALLVQPIGTNGAKPLH